MIVGKCGDDRQGRDGKTGEGFGCSDRQVEPELFEKETTRLQGELVQMQLWVKEAKAKIAVLSEGRDAAGRGVIKRITERTSPRVFRVVALPAPSEREQTQVFAQRYIERFPTGGEICLFDRRPVHCAREAGDTHSRVKGRGRLRDQWRR